MALNILYIRLSEIMV